MGRSVKEWIGATDDQRAPPRVRQRIFDRDSTCHLCDQPIQTGEKWDMDHVIALINGGENRESNLRPAHRKCHKDKTALDVAEKAKVATVRQKHIGAIQPKQSIPSRGFGLSEHAAKRQASQKMPLPPRRSLYQEMS